MDADNFSCILLLDLQELIDYLFCITLNDVLGRKLAHQKLGDKDDVRRARVCVYALHVRAEIGLNEIKLCSHLDDHLHHLQRHLDSSLRL